MASCDVLVTGAGGFVGRHLIDSARRAGLNVRAAEGDLRDAAVADENIRAAEPRAVVHLAAPPSGRDAWLTLIDDLAMAGAVLRAVGRHAPGAAVLFAGSAAQYGMGAQRRLTEQDPVAPVSSYGVGKCVLESAVTAGPLRGAVRVIFTRSFNHIGPEQGTDAPAAQWARQIMEAEAAGGGTIRTGDLDVVRDFLDVRDVADAYLALIRSPAEGIVNVCSGAPVALRRLAEDLVRRSTVPLLLEHDPALTRAPDPPYVVGDPSRLRDLTGWSRRISLDQSLGDLLDACRRNVQDMSSVTPAP